LDGEPLRLVTAYSESGDQVVEELDDIERMEASDGEEHDDFDFAKKLVEHGAAKNGLNKDKADEIGVRVKVYKKKFKQIDQDEEKQVKALKIYKAISTKSIELNQEEIGLRGGGAPAVVQNNQPTATPQPYQIKGGSL